MLLILLFYIYRLKWTPTRPDFYPLGKMITIGHRGAPVLAPENTLESFTKAFEVGLKGIELDVQLSKDGELVVFHDLFIKNKTGKYTKIENMSYSEIRDLSRENNCQIPLLSDVMEIHPKGTFINIEIKSCHYLKTLIVRKVVQMIQIYNLEKFIIVSSFNPFVLRFIKKLAPDYPTAYLWSSNNSTFLFNSPLWIWICLPDGIHIDINIVNEKNICWARKNNLVVLAFTVNNASDLSKAQALGLDGIFTDNPHLNTGSASL